MRYIKWIIVMLVTVAFFGLVPRDIQKGAPTIFAIASILVFNITRGAVNLFMSEEDDVYHTTNSDDDI